LQGTLSRVSVKIKLFDVEIKTFLKKKMYFSKEVFAKTNLGKKIIKFLFDKVKKKPNKFFKKNTNKNDTLERQVSDFIAGMTDRYAINLYNSLK
jgi:dGTPase